MLFTSNKPGHYNACKFRSVGGEKYKDLKIAPANPSDKVMGNLGFFETDEEDRIVMLLTSSWYKKGIIKTMSEDKETVDQILALFRNDKLSPVGQILSARAVDKPMTEPAAQKPYQAPPAVRLDRDQLVAKAKEMGIKQANFKKSDYLEKKLGIVYGGS